MVSTYHQCVKGMTDMKPIRIPGNQMSFNQIEVHYSDAEFYNDFSSVGPNHIMWKSPKRVGITHQANKAPKKTEDVHTPATEDGSLQKIMHMPKCLQDGFTAVAKELEDLNLSDDHSIQKMISISVYLTVEEMNKLVNLLKEFKDVFFGDMKRC
ncbi:hypothetical protein D8674_020266 [Pyrus ussuriensis x Pyrus communis]|uniref:Uncharacterized protein n=1 Tax=Pyrus ussuriensis x Pyrus communis TaxID=2448454 RepID=A0A5N5HG95_9ROSA|nr:hypothetical protein D8674_020266 [Pyrus ussuriensis x Pyrus communis]